MLGDWERNHRRKTASTRNHAAPEEHDDASERAKVVTPGKNDLDEVVEREVGERRNAAKHYNNQYHNHNYNHNHNHNMNRQHDHKEATYM